MNIHIISEMILLIMCLVLMMAFLKQKNLLKKESLASQRQKEIKGIVRSISEGIITLDLQGKVLHLNKHAKEMLNTPMGEDLKGRHLEEFIYLPSLFEAVEELGEHKVFAKEINHLDKIYNLKVTHLKSGDNEIIGHLFVLSDITRMRKLEMHRKEFVANVSHELRTPLTSIQGACDILLKNDHLASEDRLKFLQMLKKNTTRLQSIVEGLLILSDLDKELKNQNTHFQSFRLLDLLENSLDVARDFAAKKQIALVLENRPPAELLITGQPSLLQQALTNLLDNAVKYGKPLGKVYLNYSLQEDFCQISVKDEGPGIDPLHHERLFERFYSVDKARSRELGGAGLGLSIVKNIMQMHHGLVKVESNVGEGAIFHLLIPHKLLHHSPEINTPTLA